ncbi:MAG: glutamine--fructose-6-phosphate transaminase (isomerizing) [Patescibacteria group bacterium]
MCGIVGYVGKNKALPILLGGLKVLEYRGYDSAGVVILDAGKVIKKKTVGPVSVLEQAVKAKKFSGHIGIGHTRWATHGAPTILNAHPHFDCEEKIFVAHNGIIENHRELRVFLTARGHKLKSQTDTEVLPHLIEDFLTKGKDFKQALLKTLKMIKGAYALVIISANNPKIIYATKISSPLVIGVGEGENFLASDLSALVGKTKKIIYLKDGELAEISEDKIVITNAQAEPTTPEITKLEWNLEQAQKGDYPHFMLKEIFEGPEVVRAALRGRLKIKEQIVKLGGLELVAKELSKIKRLIILGCGTSYYAGLIGEYFFEEIAQIPTEVAFASEFRYRNEPFEVGTVVIAISQSGETADTLAALTKAKEKGLLTLGIVNVVGSTIARETKAGVYNHAGPEIGVASTKAFLSQLTTLLLMAIYFAKDKKSFPKNLLHEIENIPAKIERILAQAKLVEKIANKYKNFNHFLFLGRRYNYPTALEGALKLKEISYIHAEGYGAGEMKHGPIAMISKDFPTLAIMPKNGVADKMHSNLEEIKARGGPIVAVATEGDELVSLLTSDVLWIPSTLEMLEPLLAVVPLQLFAYYIGTQRGFNVDRPRNLAKSVTVE